MKAGLKTLKVVAFLLLILGIGWALAIATEKAIRSSEEEILSTFAPDIGETVSRALRHAMLTRDLPMIREILEQLKSNDRLRGIQRVRIINKSGKLVFSTVAGEEGKSYNIRDRVCSSCHAGSSLKHSSPAPGPDQTHFSVVGRGGSAQLDVFQPIRNDEACHKCHDQAYRLTGIFQITYAAGSIQKAMDNVRKKAHFLGLISFFTLLAGVGLFMERAVLRPAREMVRANTELQERQDQLITLTMELDRANRVKNEFLANVSHELRTPLNSVIGFSQVLIDEASAALDSVHRQFLQNIMQSGKHLLGLINDLLDLTRIESGKVELQYEVVNLKWMWQEVRGVLAPKVGGKEIHLSMRIDQAPHVVQTDKGRLKQVLINLLNNAVKFTPQKGKVELRISRSGNEILFAVHDTGIGIKKEDQEMIFEAFRQVDSSYSRTTEGTGLGLAITRGLVQKLGGRIWVESEEGKGSIFFFTLPVIESPPGGSPGGEAPGKGQPLPG